MSGLLRLCQGRLFVTSAGVFVEGDRIQVAGLRRGKISGLQWSDIELDDSCGTGMLTVAHNRVSVGGQVHDTDPTTERASRTLRLTPALAKALKRAKAVQAAEHLRLAPTGPLPSIDVAAALLDERRELGRALNPHGRIGNRSPNSASDQLFGPPGADSASGQ